MTARHLIRVALDAGQVDHLLPMLDGRYVTLCGQLTARSARPAVPGRRVCRICSAKATPATEAPEEPDRREVGR